MAFSPALHKILAHEIIKAVIIAPVRRSRFLFRRGVPQFKQVIVIPGRIRIKPVVETVCRPKAAELVPAEFFIETALPDELF